MVNKSLPDVTKLNFCGMVLTNQNFMLEEVEEEVKFRNACHPLAYSLLRSCLLSKNVKVKVYRTVILSCFV
jgi:hypothetical protein